jgi:pimeloyl-ACP methyl ester carboxylesterase
MDGPSASKSPLELLGAIGMTNSELRPGLRLIEVYTMQRMLKLLWFGNPAASEVVVMMAGAMGGFSGPARALYLEFADRQVARGRGAIIVDYRKPGDLDRSLLDVAATVDWSMREGGRRFAMVGHSFGGAVAVQAGAMLSEHCAGVVTLSTQSAGCQIASELGGIPLLLLHGDRDEVLTPDNSAMVRMMAGYGDFRIIEGAGHGLETARDELLDLLDEWITERFSGTANTDN